MIGGLGAGRLRVRVSLTLLAALKAAGQGGGYGVWLWRLLEGPTGSLILGVDSEGQAEDAHALCMTQVPLCKTKSLLYMA